MAMGGYGPPLDRLLTIREEPGFGFVWNDYLALGIGPEHVPDLIRMATDPDLDEASSQSPEVWAPVHAWRALGQLRAEAAAAPLMEILFHRSENERDDWASENLPTALGMIGPVAISAAAAIFEDESRGRFTRIDAARVLSAIGLEHPEARDQCVATLSRSLERAEWHDLALNAFVVCELIALDAKEAAGVIERAYAGDFVDDSISGSWHDVWHDLDLEGEPPPRTERKHRPDFGLLPNLLDAFELYENEPPPPSDSPGGWQPVEVRTPEERKDRNKARQKLEQKVKGKKGKKR